MYVNALVSLVLMDFSWSKSLNQPTLLSLNTSFLELLVVTSFPKPESIVNPVTLTLPELNRLGFHPVYVPTITILIIANVFM